MMASTAALGFTQLVNARRTCDEGYSTQLVCVRVCLKSLLMQCFLYNAHLMQAVNAGHCVLDRAQELMSAAKQRDGASRITFRNSTCNRLPYMAQHLVHTPDSC